jgi:hypothetical protein
VVEPGGSVQVEKEGFEAEAERLLGAARTEGVTLRLLGALAFNRHCPRFGRLQQEMGRRYTDIDLAGYGRDVERIRRLMTGLGYGEDQGVYVESEGSRLIFGHPVLGLHVDVFLDKLEFCHTISWNGRLELDDPTIPLAELLLEKMQIVEINEKDVVDTVMLLLEHPLGSSDDDTVNIEYVARLCARDWGLWRTLTMNLGKVEQLAAGYPQLRPGEKQMVTSQVRSALERIDREPKSLGWRLRARVGDRKKWYRDVGEFVPGLGDL